MQRAKQDSLGGSGCQTQAFVVRLGTLQPLYDLDLFFGVAQLGGEGSFLSTVLHRRHHPFKQGLKQHGQCSSPSTPPLQTRPETTQCSSPSTPPFKQGLQQHRQCSSPLTPPLQTRPETTQCSSPLSPCLQTRIGNADSILHHRLCTFKQGIKQCRQQSLLLLLHLWARQSATQATFFVVVTTLSNKVSNNNICRRTRSATTTFVTEQGLQQQHSSQNKVCNNNIRHRTRSATKTFVTEQGLQQQNLSQNKVCNNKIRHRTRSATTFVTEQGLQHQRQHSSFKLLSYQTRPPNNTESILYGCYHTCKQGQKTTLLSPPLGTRPETTQTTFSTVASCHTFECLRYRCKSCVPTTNEQPSNVCSTDANILCQQQMNNLETDSWIINKPLVTHTWNMSPMPSPVCADVSK